MGIYISNLKIPKDEYLPINIYPDGRVACRFDANCANAIELPAHGDLIDRDALIVELMDRGVEGLQTDDWHEIQQAVADAPTIIPAEGG